MAECANIRFNNNGCCSEGAVALEPCKFKQHGTSEMLERLEIYKKKVSKADYKRAKWVIENTDWGITLSNKSYFHDGDSSFKIKNIDVNSRFFQIEYHAE